MLLQYPGRIVYLKEDGVLLSERLIAIERDYVETLTQAMIAKKLGRVREFWKMVVAVYRAMHGQTVRNDHPTSDDTKSTNAAIPLDADGHENDGASDDDEEANHTDTKDMDIDYGHSTHQVQRDTREIVEQLVAHDTELLRRVRKQCTSPAFAHCVDFVQKHALTTIYCAVHVLPPEKFPLATMLQVQTFLNMERPPQWERLVEEFLETWSTLCKAGTTVNTSGAANTSGARETMSDPFPPFPTPAKDTAIQPWIALVEQWGQGAPDDLIRMLLVADYLCITPLFRLCSARLAYRIRTSNLARHSIRAMFDIPAQHAQSAQRAARQIARTNGWEDVLCSARGNNSG